MRSTSWLSLALAAVLAGPGMGAASAEELNTPAAAPEASSSRPARGMSMEKVEASFGAPTRRVPAVGGGNAQQPPITRWEYPGFVVYFENNLVVHTVAIG
jgi:hypothetical protein